MLYTCRCFEEMKRKNNQIISIDLPYWQYSELITWTGYIYVYTGYIYVYTGYIYVYTKLKVSRERWMFKKEWYKFAKFIKKSIYFYFPWSTKIFYLCLTTYISSDLGFSYQYTFIIYDFAHKVEIGDTCTNQLSKKKN